MEKETETIKKIEKQIARTTDLKVKEALEQKLNILKRSKTVLK